MPESPRPPSVPKRPPPTSKPPNKPPNDRPGTGTPPPPPPSDDLGGKLDALASRQTWIRLLLIILGLILLFMGIVRMSAQSDTAKSAGAVAKAGLQFVPGGGVVTKGVKAVASGKPSKVVGAAKSIAKASK